MKKWFMSCDTLEYRERERERERERDPILDTANILVNSETIKNVFVDHNMMNNYQPIILLEVGTYLAIALITQKKNLPFKIIDILSLK